MELLLEFWKHVRFVGVPAPATFILQFQEWHVMYHSTATVVLYSRIYRCRSTKNTSFYVLCVKAARKGAEAAVSKHMEKKP